MSKLLSCQFYIQPGAKESAIAGLYGDILKIRIKARAVDGKANTALIAFLAAELDIPPSSITLLKGSKNRLKTLQFPAEYSQNCHPLLHAYLCTINAF